MKKYLLACIVPFFCFFCSIPSLAQAQLLDDPATVRLVQETIDHIYNYEFDEAQALSQQVRTKYPQHPVTHLLKAFQMYWQYLPIQDNKAKSAEYLRTLNQCLAAVEKQYGSDSKNPEAVFFTLAARGYMAVMYNYQREFLKAVGEAQKAYSALTTSLKLTEKNPEFYFTTGMYNYYVVTYPEDNPIVKPVMIFFKNGDKALGLKQIDIATQRGVITRAEACSYLAHIYLEHESQPQRALVYTRKLAGWYPQNPIYKIMHTEALLLSGRYAEAEKELPALRKRTDGFYPIAWRTFQGILYEKDDRNDALAQREYLAALQIPHDEQYTREYHAMAYAGLARIAHRAGNKAQAKAYYKKCLEKAEYKALIKEAKAYK